MKILQVLTPDSAVIRDVSIPQPGSGEVLMRIDAVTTCPQWDLHLRHDEPMFVGHRFTYPYTPGQPGHEATGVVEAVGDGVVSVRSGDRVSAWRDPGHDRPGCYAQYAVHQADDLIRVPPDLPPGGIPPERFPLRPADLQLCRYRGHFRESAEYAVALIQRGKLDLSPLVTHRLPLEHYGQGIDLLESRRALKVCFLPWEEP